MIDEPLREVQEDERLAAGVVHLGDGVELRAVDDDEVGLEPLQDLGVELAQEHVAGEHAVPGGLGDDPQLQAVLGVGAGVAVLDEDVAALEVGLQPDLQQLEVLGVERLVVLAPPDLVLARRLADDELVVGRAPRVLAGPDDERAQMADGPLAATDRLLVQRRRRQVVEDGSDVRCWIMRRGRLSGAPISCVCARTGVRPQERRRTAAAQRAKVPVRDHPPRQGGRARLHGDGSGREVDRWTM